MVPMVVTGMRTTTMRASFHDNTNRYRKPPMAVTACRTLGTGVGQGKGDRGEEVGKRRQGRGGAAAA